MSKPPLLQHGFRSQLVTPYLQVSIGLVHEQERGKRLKS